MARSELVKLSTFPALAGKASEEVMAAIHENMGGNGITEFDLDRIKIPAGGGLAFEVPDPDGAEPEVQKTVEGIVVYFRDVRSYWATLFSGGADPPQCTSPNSVDGYGDPGDALGQAGACNRCPYSKFGSDPRADSNAQACKQMRQLFLLRPGAVLPTLVVLPPTSIRPARQYFLQMAQRGRIYRHVLTRIGLKKTSNSSGIDYSLATFAVAGEVATEDRASIDAYAAGLRPAFERTPVDVGYEVDAETAARTEPYDDDEPTDE
jgi:hypothetical protein